MPEWSNGAVSKTVVRVTGPGVRIPFSPQHMNDPANGGVIYFTEGAMKACFQEHLRENKKDLKGHSCVGGSPPGIMSEANNPLCPFRSGCELPGRPRVRDHPEVFQPIPGRLRNDPEIFIYLPALKPVAAGVGGTSVNMVTDHPDKLN